ncbi:antitoxin MazE family protein [Arthrobacter tumbae]|uniref:antitoxin MazE family protein n=1 Tax=Arthrobacter tumbae TaxID=163874 RepID=UPI00195A8B25|nr:antitoxin MazE family protein [Arthrobacter tumbae]
MTHRTRVLKDRKRLREQGLRPIQIWVPDVRSPEFAAAAHCQSVLVAASGSEVDDQAFVDAIAVEWDAGPGECPRNPGAADRR